MMLVERDYVEAKVFGVAVFIEIVMVVFRSLFAVVELVRDAEKSAVFENLFFRQPSIGPLGKIANLHPPTPLRIIPCDLLVYWLTPTGSRRV